MPNGTGLPKVGEVWERTWKLPPDWKEHRTRFVVLARGRGDYWSLTVAIPGDGKFTRKLWVDAAAWFAWGELMYIDKAGPKTRKELGLS